MARSAVSAIALAFVIGMPPIALAEGDPSDRLDVPVVSDDPNDPVGISAIDGKNVHNVSNIWLNVTNFGIIGSQPGFRQPWSEAASAQWPAPSRTEYLWSAGLWVGALLHGDAHVTTAQAEPEFRATRGPLGQMYKGAEGDAGGARAPALNKDDDRDGRSDEDPLDGRDNDNDGRIDEDFAAVSTQMFVCEYNDSDPGIPYVSEDHEALGIKVQQTSMAWDEEDKRDFIAFNFKITTTQFLQGLYVGLFADPDIGPPDASARGHDDMAGFWEGDIEVNTVRVRKMVHVSIGYMWDADSDGVDSEGYIGFMFLGHERRGYGTSASNRRVHPLGLHNFRSFSGRAPFIVGGEPSNDAERYEVLRGTARGSLPTGRQRAPRSTETPNDYRFVVSAQPFGGLSPGDTLGITAALIMGRGLEGLKKAAVQAQLAFDGAWANCDGDINTGVDGREDPHCGPEESGEQYPIRGPDVPRRLHAVPCDSLCRDISWWNFSRCSVTVPANRCVWIDGDCDATTGVDGNECLVHWFTQVPPPPPRMRLVASENKIEVLFDNRSELAIDPVLNIPDFESYRIWRADDWPRPPGSDTEIGPEAGKWTLLGEYDVRGNGIGRDIGFTEIQYVPKIPLTYIEFCREWDHAHPTIRPPILYGLTEAHLDTALAMARGTRYYRWVDPAFIAAATAADPPCRADGGCDPVEEGPVLSYRRCDERGRCRAARWPPRSGAHYFYAVTATDHRMERRGTAWVARAAGIAGDPSTNFRYVAPPTNALQPEEYANADREIYVVPNPATARSMAPWALHPNNDDPTGVKIEFHHLPAAQGKVTVFTLAGDMVKVMPFDGRGGNGTLAWDLVNRNGQEVTSGVYLFTVEANDPAFKRFISKFVVVR